MQSAGKKKQMTEATNFAYLDLCLNWTLYSQLYFCRCECELITHLVIYQDFHLSRILSEGKLFLIDFWHNWNVS